MSAVGFVAPQWIGWTVVRVRFWRSLPPANASPSSSWAMQTGMITTSLPATSATFVLWVTVMPAAAGWALKPWTNETAWGGMLLLLPRSPRQDAAFGAAVLVLGSALSGPRKSTFATVANPEPRAVALAPSGKTPSFFRRT